MKIKIQKFLKKVGMRTILTNFDDDISAVRKMLKLECEFSSPSTLNTVIASFKKELKEKISKNKNFFRYQKIVQDLIKKIGE